MATKARGLGRTRAGDSRVELALAPQMMLIRRDAFVPEHRRHQRIRMRHRPHAALFAYALRLQVVAQAIVCFDEVALLLRRPSRGRSEESMLDGIARDAGFAGHRARAGRASGIAPVRVEAALADYDGTAPKSSG